MKLLTFFVFQLILMKETESYGRLSQQENEELRKICGRVPNLNQNGPNMFKWISGIKNIVGGIPIPGYIAPWSVHLVSAGTNCSGTIISPRHILSAAHCVVEDPTIRNKVLYGSETRCDEKHKDQIYTGIFKEIKVYSPSGQRVQLNVIKLVTLNLCDSYDFWSDDIMILELEHDLEYSEFAQPVCTARDTTFNHPGLTVHMSTYGHNNSDIRDNRGVGELRYGAMKIDKLDSRGGPYFSVFDPKYVVNMRGGDSGGGAISYEYGSRYVVGVVSHGKNGVTYFTSVGHHFQQICTHTGIC